MMKKRVSTFLLATLLTFTMGMTVFATQAPGLDEIVAGSSITSDVGTTETEETTAQETEAAKSYTNRSFTDSLTEAMDLSQETKVSADFSKTANYYGSIAFQVITILVCVGMLLMVGVDMIYIVLPFTRKMLGGPAQPQGGAGAPGQPGGGMGLASGLGSSGYGMSSGLGGSGYGSGLGGYGRTGFSNPMAGRGTMQPAQQAAGGGVGQTQIVSDAAILAVQSQAQSNMSALISYIKNMAITIVLCTVILVLAGTGVLSTFGLALGTKLTSIIRGLIAGLA
jgi:hypothetical protein